jgi:hypothetical protein
MKSSHLPAYWDVLFAGLAALYAENSASGTIEAEVSISSSRRSACT